MAISTTNIEDSAKSPQRVRTDEGTIQEKGVQELIDADRYANAKTAVDAVPWGLRIARGKPAGTVPGSPRT